MQKIIDLVSKTGIPIQLTAIEVSSSPILTIVSTPGGFTETAIQDILNNSELVKYCETKNINYVSIDLSHNGVKDQDFDLIRYGDRVLDLQTVIDYCVATYSSKILLVGSSMGGFITLNNATYSQNVIGILLNCASVDLIESIRNTNDVEQFNHWKERKSAIIWDVPMKYDFYEDILKHNVLSVLPKIYVPVLWFHGTDDLIVPITQARNAADMNPLIELIEIERGGHRFGKNMKPGEWEVKVENFVEKLVS